MISLIVFLGNPGETYSKTRHNIGWMAADHWVPAVEAGWTKKFKGLYGKTKRGRNTIHLLKPLTLMNRSGESLIQAASFFNFQAPDILVVHDQLEKPFGSVQLKEGGGTAGHNGLRSIVSLIGKDFFRLEIGISRPARGDVSSYVLSRFTPAEEEELEEILRKVSDLLDRAVGETIE